MQDLRYGEKILKEFDIERDLEVWENKHERDYLIKITLPEFCCLCPRSGYPDFATIYLEYIPDKLVIELKAIKLYINSFLNRNISHEDSINEIYSVLEQKLKPKFMKITGDFNPRGNVHTIIEICSENIIKKSENLEQNFKKTSALKKRSDKILTSKKASKSKNFSDEKPKRAPKEGFKKINYENDKKPRIVKKDR